MPAAKKPIGENGLRIVSLIAENVKKLTAVEIRPDGRMVKITGGNAQGKSSILDCIWLACDRASNPQEQPIRSGQKQARIRVDFGEIVVERRFNDKGGSLTVESAEGASFKSPQTMLDQFFGSLSFDPLAFTRMDPKKQVAALREIAQVDVDIDVLEGQIASDFQKRTDVNRDAKARRAAAEAIAVPKDLPAELVDEKALLDEIQAAGEHNVQIETRKARRVETQNEANLKKQQATAKRDRAAELREQAAALDREAASLLESAATLERKIDEAEALPEPIDVAALRARLDQAQSVNRQIGLRERRAVIEADYVELERQSAALTAAIDERRKQIADAIAAAKMPVPGLGFADGVVTYNGIPFNQASAAEQLTVSFAIAKAANPKLRVILIKDASLLDEKSLERLADMAKDGDYQIWLEKVDSSGKIGFYIEDGAVRAVDGEPVKAEAAAA